jgi:hypothetical protein
MGSWTDDECEYGWRCANLKSIWTALLANDVDALDYEVPVSGGAVSLLDIDAQSGHLRTEQEREFFNVRYRDIIRNQGGSTDISADDRPELVMRSTFYASGYDVDGTDQSSLGQHTGRVNAAFRHRVPRKFLPEHGMIWTVALVRFPVVHEEENHYFCNNPSPTYLEIAGDPALLGVQPPFGLKISDVFSNSSSTTVRGFIPYAQWYRTHPSHVSPRLDTLNGFPFMNDTPSDLEDMVMFPTDSFDEIFQTAAVGHWSMQARVNCDVRRRVPSARAALLAGVQ